MTTYIVTRHEGAMTWMAAEFQPEDDRPQDGEEAVWLTHLEAGRIREFGPGDRVAGVLPINLAADVCLKGAEYWHLSMDVPSEHRGRELTAEEMDDFGAKLVRYAVQPVDDYRMVCERSRDMPGVFSRVWTEPAGKGPQGRHPRFVEEGEVS